MPVYIPNSCLEFTYFRKNTPTELHIGKTNLAVMRLGNSDRFRQGVTYFVGDIILGPTVLAKTVGPPKNNLLTNIS